MRRIFLINTLILFAIIQQLKAQKMPAVDSLLHRPVSLTMADSNIGEVLSNITELYKINFSYIQSDIPLQRKASVNAENIPLEQVLSQLFTNTRIIFFQVHDQIVLAKRKEIKDFTEQVKKDSVKYKDSVEIHQFFVKQEIKRKVTVRDLLLGWEKAELSRYSETAPDNLKTDTLIYDSIVYINTEARTIRVKKIRHQILNVRTPTRPLFNIQAVVSVGNTWWIRQVEQNFYSADRKHTTYRFPNLNIAAGFELQMKLEKVFFQTGVIYHLTTQNAIHHDFYKNTLYNNVFKISTSYHEKYHYIAIPLNAGFIVNTSKRTYNITAGLMLERLLQYRGEELFRIYKDQLFSNSNPSASGFSTGSSNYDILNNEIIQVPKHVRDWRINATIAATTKVHIIPKLNFNIGPEISFVTMSLYATPAPIKDLSIATNLKIVVPF